MAQTIKKTFSRETSVSIDINANPRKIWTLLTNTENYPNWNSTVLSIDGKIELGKNINLTSSLDSKRVFKLKIKELELNSKLVWGDAMGNREYKLTPTKNGMTKFSMIEKIGGPLFPLFANMIPSFDESFDKFANDLKIEAEK